MKTTKKQTQQMLNIANILASNLRAKIYELEQELKKKDEAADMELRKLAIYERLAAATASITENIARTIMYGTNQRFGGGQR